MSWEGETEEDNFRSYVSRGWIRKFNFDVPSREEQIGTPQDLSLRGRRGDRGARGRRGGNSESEYDSPPRRDVEESSEEEDPNADLQRGMQEEQGGLSKERMGQVRSDEGGTGEERTGGRKRGEGEHEERQ